MEATTEENYSASGPTDSSTATHATDSNDEQYDHQQPSSQQENKEPSESELKSQKSFGSVIEELKERGLEDLAAEILRLTSVTDEGAEEEEDREDRMSKEKQTSIRSGLAVPTQPPSRTLSTSNHNVKVGAVRSDSPPRAKEARLSFLGNDAKSSSHEQNPVGLTMVSGSFNLGSSKLDPTSAPSVASARPEHDSTFSSLSSSGNSAQLTKEKLDADPSSSSVPAPPALRRENQTTGTTQRFPGAFSVAPSLPATDSNAEIDTQSRTDDEVDLEEPPEVDDPQIGTADSNPNGQGNEALEAVRVDDIMTVKAEPLETQSNANLYKIIACVSCAAVAIVLVLALPFTLGKGDSPETQAAAPTPTTYEAEERLELIQDVLVEDFAPLYDQNYNATNGTLVLEEAFLTNTTPQHQALQWIARNDPELQAVTRPFLEEFQDNEDSIPASDLSLFGEDSMIATGTRGGGNRNRRRLNRISRNRIVQRYALAVLYYSTGNWTDSFEFLSEGHECDWSGALQCSEQLAITHLDLRNNALEGTIPLELAALTHLESLNLASNDLEGTLPPSLYALSELKALDLGFNKLTGSIPDVYYQNWGQLESWSLAESDLTGTISSHIGNLEHLKSLTWQRNELHGAVPPAFWAKLTNMEVLDLSQQTKKFINDTIGTEIGMWSNLRSLIYHGLELRGTIPTELGLLTLLDRLQIAANHLSGTIPSELGQLTAVTRLSLSLNAITGTVPTEFIHLTSLNRLYLQNTLLSGDVSFLCDAIDEGILPPIDPMRVDMGEVSGCSCCTCCLYRP